MNRPAVGLVVAINHVVRREDEWFDEPDELDRVAGALAAIDRIEDPVEAAAVLAFRVTRAQAFAEGNKRTALLVARWVLDRNGLEGAAFLPLTIVRWVRCLSKRQAVRTSVLTLSRFYCPAGSDKDRPSGLRSPS